MEEPIRTYSGICEYFKKQFIKGFNKPGTKNKFATRGMVREVLSRSSLETLYKSLWDDKNFPPAGQNPVDANHFVQNMEKKMLHDFLAVLLYAQCSINAARIFANEFVFGGRAEEQNTYGETPYLLPAGESYLDDIFDESDVQNFFNEQRPFCTIILGGAEVVKINQDDNQSLPWLEEEKIGFGAFGNVYRVKIAQGHLTEHRDFNVTNSTPKLVARKDYRPAMNMEQSFEQEVKSIRDIFRANQKHENILKSFGTIVIEDPEPKFSLLMPLADMDLQKFMETYAEIPFDDRWARERIVSAAIGLADGLEFLHSKMTTVGGHRLVCYHMDLKPGNILVFMHEPGTENTSTENKDYGMVWKLSDFGLSRVKTKSEPEKNLDSLFEKQLVGQSSKASATQNHRGNGTYLPNEAQDRKKTMDQNSDIWSLGCIISVLFTYMEEGYQALSRYSASRLKYNKKFDVFYQENRSSRGISLNEAVKAQHKRLIEAARKRNVAEGEAVSSILGYLESSVLLIDQGSRCNAGSIVQCLKRTLGRYQTAETFVITPSTSSKSHRFGRMFKNAFGFGQRQKQSNTPVNIHRWRLEIDKSIRFKDCQSSPDGKLIAYWSDKDIMVFDRASTAPWTSSSTSDVGSRTTSTESPRDQTLRNAGQYHLSGVSCSWKSLGMTNKYLVAATTETKSLNCYLFDIESDRSLQTYSKVILPYPGLHSLTVSSTEDAMACILSNSGRATLLTAEIDINTSEPATPSPSVFSETSSRPDYQDAGIRLVRRKLLDPEHSTSEIEHLSLRTSNEGYMIIRQSPILALHPFTVQPPRILKQDLKLKSPGSTANRLFTDMASYKSETDEAQSEAIVVQQAQHIFHLKCRGANELRSSIVYPQVRDFRILKIATDGQVVVALGSQSGSSHLFLLEVKLSNPGVRPQLLEIVELNDVSISSQYKLSIFRDWNEAIALIMTTSSQGQHRVYQKHLSSLVKTNT